MQRFFGINFYNWYISIYAGFLLQDFDKMVENEDRKLQGFCGFFGEGIFWVKRDFVSKWVLVG